MSPRPVDGRLLQPPGVPADGRGLRPPEVVDAIGVDADLAPARVVGRLLQLPLRRGAAGATGIVASPLKDHLRRGRPNLSRALGEVLDQRPGDAGDVGLAVLVDRLPAHAEGAGQLGPEGQLVDGAGRLQHLGAPHELAAVEGPPLPVVTERPVGDQDVGVQLRIALAARAVEVGAGDEAAAVDLLDAVGSTAGVAGVALDVGQARLHGGGFGGLDLAGDLRRRQRPQETHRLGRREGHAEAGDPVLAHPLAKRFTGDGVLAVEDDPVDVVHLDLGARTEADVLQAGAHPATRPLTLAAEVVLHAAVTPGHVVEVADGLR